MSTVEGRVALVCRRGLPSHSLKGLFGGNDQLAPVKAQRHRDDSAIYTVPGHGG